MDIAPLVMISIPVVHAMRKSLETAIRLPLWDRFLSKFWIVSLVLLVLAHIPPFRFIEDWYGRAVYFILLYTVYQLRYYRPSRLFSIALLPYAVVYLINSFLAFIMPDFFESNKGLPDTAQNFAFLWLLGFGIYALIQNNKEVKLRRKEEERIRQAEARKAELEHLVTERTTELTQQKEELEKALTNLKAAQTQLIHSEKMASLGELTAGIAHEIQNPLNFVNNFSELSVELAQELTEELGKNDFDRELVKDLLRDLSQNQEKINHHGKRAASIVSGMLQHSRAGTGVKEPVDINALADEYLRLSYHGLRAKDKSFNAKMETDFDPAVGRVNVVPQDFGRVLLNLINNAFYAVHQRAQSAENYSPTVWVSTKKQANGIEIRVRDNGTGIPNAVKAKIFQPFFTTKPSGQGTGLGLSLSYDIVTKGHAGTLEVETKEGEGTTFLVRLPA